MEKIIESIKKELEKKVRGEVNVIQHSEGISFTIRKGHFSFFSENISDRLDILINKEQTTEIKNFIENIVYRIIEEYKRDIERYFFKS